MGEAGNAKANRRRIDSVARACDTPRLIALPRREKKAREQDGAMHERFRDPALIDVLTGIVSRASAAILQARAGALATRQKADRSPVTAADEASEAVILDGLAKALPGVPAVSEEAGASAGLAGDTYLLVDPLDGTRELVAGRDEFCVNVALVSAGRPRLGVIGSPVLGLIWRTSTQGAERLKLAPGAEAKSASERSVIRSRPWPETGAVAAISRSHLNARSQAFLARLPPTEKLASGSAMKLCRLAEGTADVYPRLGEVHQWDLAAGEAIVTAAGGLVTTPEGAPVIYDPKKERFLVDGFIAWGDPTAPARFAN